MLDPAVKMEIEGVEFPYADPVTGESEVLLELWKKVPYKTH